MQVMNLPSWVLTVQLLVPWTFGGLAESLVLPLESLPHSLSLAVHSWQASENSVAVHKRLTRLRMHGVACEKSFSFISF